MRPRRYSDDDIRDAVRLSTSIAQVLTRLGLSPTGANYKGMHAHFRRLGIDTAHFTGQGHLKGKRHSWTPGQPLAEVLIQASPYRNTFRLKIRLIREGLLAYKCSECGTPPEWQGKPLVLILDHRNGDRADHRLENLRLLCPNCNSQQPTFAGKNKGRYATDRFEPFVVSPGHVGPGHQPTTEADGGQGGP
jgi:hypothetical protein